MDFSNKKVLIILAHQDDETIGCGGSIKKWSSNGATVEVCFMTDGRGSTSCYDFRRKQDKKPFNAVPEY